MPVTFAHPIAVAPLARSGLPLAALVIGSMVPDSGLFIRAIPGLDTLLVRLGNPALPSVLQLREILHSPWGVLTINVVIGLLYLALWWWLLRPAYRDALPKRLRGRTHARPTGLRPWLLAVPAFMIGGLTHIAWDQVTHPYSWLAQRVDVLQSSIAGFHIATLLHYGTGLLGLLAVAYWLVRRITNRSEHTVPQILEDQATWMFAVPALAAMAGVFLVLVHAARATVPGALDVFIQDVLTNSTAAAICAATVMAVIHRFRVGRIERRKARRASRRRLATS